MRNTKKKHKYARSAFTHNPEVVGSSPASATIKTTPFGVVFLFLRLAKQALNDLAIPGGERGGAAGEGWNLPDNNQHHALMQIVPCLLIS